LPKPTLQPVSPGPHPEFPRKPLIIFVVLAVLPAVIAISWYLLHERHYHQLLKQRLTAEAMRVLRSAPSVTAFHLTSDDITTATRRVAGLNVVQQSPILDDYFVMRLRKALLAPGNTDDDRPPCSGPPQLAFQLADNKSTVTILLNLLCRTLHTVATDGHGRTLEQGHATLSQLGAQQLSFLEAEAFQPR
jgi:hypothetical protein